MSSYIKRKNKYYILANSSLADERTMVLKHNDAFAVFDRYGDVIPVGQAVQGLYYNGTRFISRSEILIDGHRPLMLSSTLKEENELLTVDLTNPDLDFQTGTVTEKGTLHIHRTKFLWNDVCYENIKFSNFAFEPLTFTLSFIFDADYTDIFEVRGIERKKWGKLLKPVTTSDELILGYKGLDAITRRTRIKFEQHPSLIKGKEVQYQLCILPNMDHTLSFAIAFDLDKVKHEILDYETALSDLNKYMDKVKYESCEIYSSNEQFNQWLQRSKSDMTTMISETPHGLYPYAGVPWYSTPFGRDGIITAWESLWLDPSLAKGVLNYLAKTQAKELNDFEDAEPGKVFHEKREGEMANLGEVPFKMYYGTIDATPLFIGLAGAYYERTNDIETIKTLWPHIERALEWIDNYGDSDNDGFVEYQKKSAKGLINQGWKDSHDSIFYEDGKLAEGSIALCEVQGYVYDAKLRAAEMAYDLGHTSKADQLRTQAQELKERFEKAFWSEDKKTYVIALDGQKKKCNVISSNAGHCLFSGIVSPEHAEKLAKTLLSEEMFSGWGIRTIASSEPRYNPMSYHNGSIWPHDNALIAYGLAKYGYREEVNKILSGMYDVTMFVQSQRLPELFCGFIKRRNEGPTAYPVACSPQAWAIASVYFLLEACLGIKIVAKENTIYFYNPTLPDFLREITITNLKVNSSNVVIQVRKNINEVTINLLHRDGDVKIEIVNEYEKKKEHPEAVSDKVYKV